MSKKTVIKNNVDSEISEDVKTESPEKEIPVTPGNVSEKSSETSILRNPKSKRRRFPKRPRRINGIEFKVKAKPVVEIPAEIIVDKVSDKNEVATNLIIPTETNIEESHTNSTIVSDLPTKQSRRRKKKKPSQKIQEVAVSQTTASTEVMQMPVENDEANKQNSATVIIPESQTPDSSEVTSIVPDSTSRNRKKKKKKKPSQQTQTTTEIVIQDTVEIQNLPETQPVNAVVGKQNISKKQPHVQPTKTDTGKQIPEKKHPHVQPTKADTGKQIPEKKQTKPEKSKQTQKTEILYSTLPKVKELSKSQLSNEFLNDFLNQVEDYLKQQAYIEPGGKILLAVSGGVDSIVMMDAVAILAHRMRFSLYVAHFNHKLRGLSADADEVLVRNVSKEYNLHFYAGSGNVKQYSSKNGLSIEHAARILRYNYFERTARNIGVDIVATAHTEDDLVETFFINLFRGSGLTGLSSMPSKRKFVKNVSLVRPFLKFSKKELYKYAEIRKLKWNEDETNSLLNYTRNKIRHDLIPKLIDEYNPSLISLINRTAELIQGADEVIKDIVTKSIINVIDEANNERFSLKINMLLTFNKFMQGELIQYSWNKYFRLQPMPLSTIDRILVLTKSQTGSICEISSGYYVLRDRNNLIFVKRIKDIPSSLIIEKPGEYKIGKYKLEIKEVKPSDVAFSDDKNIEYIPASLMEPFVEIRNKKEGDNFFPLGAPGEMKLSDFLTNEKVSLVDKPNVLILTNKIDILWVMGYRISEKCRVKKSSNEKIYRLKMFLSDKK
ncbi:MAG: tRNA lysidine(34) synthetase TilS [Candidatus Kapabacteria bacterium]|nr:tRNA lysidine(34) synthetase TilS [Ignavibacteriota bacterium]MCW5886161.1 tRNA lysidine(34) synthetase TilS [Candidatus Kapabacteria bacterium]